MKSRDERRADYERRETERKQRYETARAELKAKGEARRQEIRDKADQTRADTAPTESEPTATAWRPMPSSRLEMQPGDVPPLLAPFLLPLQAKAMHQDYKNLQANREHLRRLRAECATGETPPQSE